MLEETEESCGHENLGEYINQFRLNLGVSIKQLCELSYQSSHLLREFGMVKILS